jgi:hypothetical protein
MIAYVGLDLGVDTHLATNSVAAKRYLREPTERKEVDAEQESHMKSVGPLSVVFDIRPHHDEGQNA